MTPFAFAPAVGDAPFYTLLQIWIAMRCIPLAIAVFFSDRIYRNGTIYSLLDTSYTMCLFYRLVVAPIIGTRSLFVCYFVSLNFTNLRCCTVVEEGRMETIYSCDFIGFGLSPFCCCFWLLFWILQTLDAAQKWRREEANSRFLPNLSKMLHTMSAWTKMDKDGHRWIQINKDKHR